MGATYHKWTEEEIQYIKDNADRETYKSIARKFNVSEPAVRFLVRHRLSEDIVDKYRKVEKGNLSKAEIECPYFTSTTSIGIKCDKCFVYSIKREKVRHHILNHCAKRFPNESDGHCQMRLMLNFIWSMDV